MGSLVRSVVRALLYVRVSTDEQARSGFSLGQQLEALRSYCQDHGIEVMGEFEDRSSGASLDRAGLDTLRDVVAGGGIDLVLCQDRDRISREPAHVFILREELRAHGTTLRALNDRGDDSPEGQLTDGIFDQLAKYERAKTLERTRRGKLQKARSGKIVGNGTAPYGFYYEDDHLHVDPDRMPYVYDIFERLAAGYSLYSTVQYLTRIGAPTPGSGQWHASTIRQIVKSDTYLGVFYYGKNRITTTNVSIVVDGKRLYRKQVNTESRPRSEWIGIPVPDSGIPPGMVTRARESLRDNVKSVSKNGGRIWELSGGVATCAECGRHMVAYTTRNSVGKTYYYYRCSNRERDACTNMRHRPAGLLENMVMYAIAETFQPHTWETFVEDLCDRKLDDLHRLGRSNSKETLAGRMLALETKLDRARELFIDGDLPRPAYEEKKTIIQGEIEVIQEELTRVDDLDAEIRRVEDLRETLLSIENPMSGHYALTSLPEDLHALEDDDVAYGSAETAARRRQEFYRRVGMKVKVGEELEISLGIGETLVSNLKTASVSSSGSTSYLPSSATSPA